MSRMVLQVRGLRKTFGKGRTAVRAVDNVRLDVAAGEVVLIMGPSGSGKTTLLTMLGGLLTPDAGRIMVDGVDLTALRPRRLGSFRLRHVGFIFQSFNLLTALRAIENVEVALRFAKVRPAAARAKARKLLEQLGMSQRLSYLPKQLSGGEKQRVSVARALANDPPLVLADEPTANLDSKAGHHVVELLRSVAKDQGKTVVIVSHDVRIADIADRVLWLEDGKLGAAESQVVVDPVCRMQLRRDHVTLSSKYRGSTYYFCSERDKKAFEAQPERWVGGGQLHGLVPGHM